MRALACRALVPFLLLTACDEKGDNPGATTSPEDTSVATTTSEQDSSVTSEEDTSVATTATVEDTSVATSEEDTSVATVEDTSVATSEEDTSVATVEDTSVTTEPTDATTTPPEDVVVGPTTHSLNFGGWTMQPADEDTWCVVLRMDNENKILVNRIRTSLSAASHHLIVYRSNATQERKTPFTCTPFVETLGGGTIPVVISQISDDEVQLPDNVAYEFEPHQMIRLEAHYLNYYPDPITTNIDVHFDTIPDGAAVQRADILFYGNIAISLDKDEVETLPWKYYGVPSGLSVFAMTGHTHQWGTNVEVEKTTSRDTPGTVVYPPVNVPFEWDEAPVEKFEPPLVFGASQGFRFRCSYNNKSGHSVGFGESANQEMCFFWGYYYPSQGPIIRAF